MRTLREVADELNEYHDDRGVVSISEERAERDHYCSGWVVRYIQVKDPDGGVNRSGEWPFLLVDDEGKLRIFSESY